MVAVEKGNHDWANVRHIDEMGKKFIQEIEQFFVNVHKLRGRKYRILDVEGPNQAMNAIQLGIKADRRPTRMLKELLLRMMFDGGLFVGLFACLGAVPKTLDLHKSLIDDLVVRVIGFAFYAGAALSL